MPSVLWKPADASASATRRVSRFRPIQQCLLTRSFVLACAAGFAACVAVPPANAPLNRGPVVEASVAGVDLVRGAPLSGYLDEPDPPLVVRWQTQEGVVGLELTLGEDACELTAHVGPARQELPQLTGVNPARGGLVRWLSQDDDTLLLAVSTGSGSQDAGGATLLLLAVERGEVVQRQRADGDDFWISDDPPAWAMPLFGEAP